MKPRRNLFLGFSAAITVAFTAPSARAIDYYWDSDGIAPGFGIASGTWAAPTASLWSTSTDGTGIPEASLSTATTDNLFFGNGATGLGAGTITVGTVNAGSLTFASGSGAIELSGGTITQAAASTITVDNASNTISSVLAGSGTSLTKLGAGILMLGGANTYSGTTILTAGTLVTGNTAALGTGAAMALNGGTLRLATDTALSSKNVTLGGNTAITLDRATSGAGFTTTFGALTSTSGSRTLTVTKGGNVTDAATLNFTGTLSVSGQTTTFDVGSGATVRLSGNSLAGAQTITMIKNGTGSLILAGNYATWDAGGATQLNGGTLELRSLMGDATAYRAALTAAAGTTLRLVNDTSTNYLSNFTASGSMGIVADRVTSAATSTTHSLGTLSIGASTLSVSRGASITGAGIGGVTFGNATLSGAATFNTAANSQLTLGGTTGLAANTLTKSGAGSMTLTGVVSGTQAAASNAISITGGLLTASNAGNTFSGDISVSGAGSVFAMAGGTFTSAAPYGRAGGTLYKQLLLTNGGAYRQTGGSFNNNAPDATNTAEGIIFNIGTGGGTLDIASGATLTIDDGTGTGTALTASQLQGSGTLTKTGAGILVLGNSTASNAVFTGQILVNEGILRLGAVTGTGVALGSTGANTVIASGAAFDIGANTGTTSEPVSITGTGIGGTGNVIFTSSTATTPSFNGPITLAGSSTIGSTTAGSMTFGTGATFNLGSNTLTLRNTSTGRIFSDGVISGLGSVVMNSTGTGDYVPRADHTYSGGTTLTAGLIAVDRDSIGSPGSPTSGPFGTGTLTIAGGQLRAGTGSNRTVGNAVTLSGDATFYTVGGEKNLTFTGPVTLSGGNRTLTANVGTTVAGTATIFSGAIGDGGNNLGLTKAGTGNLVLGGVNTYTGVTGSTGGNLLVTGSLANNSGLSIAPAAASGAAISFINNAANTPANFNSLALGSATGTSFIGLDLGTLSDSIATTTAATTSNNISFNLNATSGFGAGTYNLISAASGLSGGAYSLSSAPGGFTYGITNTDSLVQLNAAAATAGSRFWRGNLSNSWSAFSGVSTTNWATDAAGTAVSASTPGAGDTVFFSATNATGPAITTTLDSNFTINDLQFLSAPTGVTNVTIGAGVIPGSLTIAPSLASAGLTLAQGAGAVTIAAPITLGAAQTWSVDSSTPGAGTASSLTVSGAISGVAANGLTFTSTAGTAPIILSAAGSTYSGGSTVSASTIVQGGATNGFSPNTAWTVNGTLNTGDFGQSTGSLVGGTGIVQNGSANARTLTIGSDNLASATFAGTIQNGSTGTLGLTKTGTGTQILSGTNTYSGATIVNGGTLKAGSTSALGVGSALTVTSPGTLDLGGNNITVASLAASTGTITDSSSPGSGGILQITGSTAIAIAATVTGSAGFQYHNNLGSNALFSNAANTYSGGTYLGNGTNRARYTLGAVTVGNGVGVGLTAGIFGTGAIHMGRATTDQGQIYVTNAGTINNPITYNSVLGTDVVGGIRLQNGANTATFNGVQTAGLSAISIGAYSSTGTLALTGRLTGSGTFSGTISNLNGNLGAGNIIATNAGLIIGASNNNIATVILNNAAANNNYTGDTYVTAQGILRTDAANQLPSGAGTGNLYVTGTVNMQGFGQATGLLSGAGTIDGISGTPTLTIGGNNASGLNFSGIIRNTAGTLSLTKTGSGTQTLSGANTYSGATGITGGTLAFSAANNLGDGSATNTITVNGGTLSYTGSTGINLTANQAITVGAGNGTLDVTSASGTLTVGSVTSSGGSLVKTGPGSVVIGGTTNLSAAGVVVNGGKLQAGFGTNGVGAITVDSSGSLSFQNSTIESLTLASSGTVLTLNNGARLGFELDGATNDSITVPTGGGLAVAAGGYTFDFFGLNAGVTATTYTLLTAPAGSNLDTFTYNLGDAPLGFNYTFLTSDTMVQLQTVAYSPIYWNNTQADGSWANVTGNSGSIGAGAGTNFTSDSAGTTDAGHAPLATETVIFNTSAIAGGPTLSTTLDGSRTIDSLQFNGANSVTSVTIAEGTGGTLTLKPASASGGIAILTGGGNATISAPLMLDNTLSTNQAWNVTDAGSTLELSGNVTFGANVNKSGAGAVTLSGANSGAGNFNLNAGTLNLNSAGALGTGDLNIAAGTTLNNSSGGAVALSANGAVNVNGDFTFTGTQSLNLGTGAVTLTNNPIVTVAASDLTLGGVVGGTSSLTKAGAGTMTLNGNNTFNGGVTLAGGTLNIGNADALGTGTLTTAGGSIDNTSGGAVTVANALNLSGNMTYVGSANPMTLSASATLATTPTITVSANTLTLGGNHSGAGGLVKAGAGTMVISGTNTYTGDTNVNTGTLNLTGSLTGNGTTNAGSSLLYGTTAGNSVVNVSGNIVNYRRFQGATNASANAAYIQTAGNVNFTSTETTNPTNTVAAAGYGYMQITGGTLTARGRFAPSNGAATTGVMYIGGSGTLDHTGGEWLLMSYSPSGGGGRSMITVDTGGTLNRVGSSNQFGLNMDRSNGYAVLNIAGGEVLNSNRAITFGNGTSANITGTTGMLNLAAGTLQIGTNMLNGNTGAGSTGNNAYLNFAGGTLKAQAALTGAIPLGGANQTFTSTIYGAIDNVGTGHDFAGGLTVDTNTFSTTLANPLVAPSNDGVAQTSLTVNGGTGYIGAPMVQFTGGTLAPGGAPAAGYAVVSNGVVTDIVITSPGSYTAAPTVTLTGGGGTGASVAVGTLVSNTSGGLTKIGNGTLVLSSAASTFAGPVTISGGTLQGSGVGTLANIGANSALGTGDATSTATNAASLVLDGGTYSIINTNASVATDRLFTVTQNGGGLSLDNGTATYLVTLNNTNAIAYTGSGARTLTFGGAHAGSAANIHTFAPLIGDAGGDAVTITKTGTTAWNLTNTGNTYTGGTNIQQGILGFASGALGTTGSITFTGNSTLLWATGNTDDISSRLVMTNAVTSTLDTNGNDVTLASAIGGGSTGSLTKAGSGILTLAASNTYTGVTTVSAGTLSVSTLADGGSSSNTGASSNAAGNLILNGGTLLYTGAAVGNDRLFSLQSSSTINSSGTGALNFNNTGSMGFNAGTAAKTLTLTGTNTGNNTIAAVIGNNTGATAIAKSGAGTWILSGANTYTGTTTVTGGSLLLNGGSVGTGTVAVTVGDASNKPMLLLGGANVSGRLVIGNAAGLSGAVYQTTGTVTAAGNATLDNFIGSGSGGYGYYQLSGGNLNSTSFMSYGNNAGTGLFYQTGGAVALSGTGWFQIGYGSTGGTGVAYLKGGTFTAPNAQLFALGYQSGANSRAEITIDGTQVTSPGTVNFGSANSTAGTGIINLRSGSLQATNIVETVAGVTSFLNFNGGTFKPAGNNTLAGLNNAYVHSGGAIVDTSLSSFTIGQALLAPAGDGVVSIPVTDGGSGYIGAPRVQITGGNSDATAVAVMVDDGTGNGTYRIESILVTNPGTSYASVPTVSLVGGSATTAATLGTITTAANASGGLTKSGANTLTLTGANTYTGTTTVSAGTLLVNGSTAAGSAVSVAAAATLGGTGTISGAVTVTGVLSPGTSIESLKIGSLIMDAGSKYVYEAANISATGADLIGVAGALSLTDVTLDLTNANLNAGTWSLNDKLTLISYGGTAVASGFSGYVDDSTYTFGSNIWRFDYNDDTAGGNYIADLNGGTKFVTLTVVPEPSTALLTLLGSLALLRRRR